MNKFKHIWHQVRMYTIPGPMSRVKYLRKKGYFRSVGERVMINSFRIPLYSNLISIGNNVWIASDVTFITHDVIHYMLNGIEPNVKHTEMLGPINIEDNVFIGNGVRIMYDTNIGHHSVIAAGSIITKDVEPNSVYAGVPAKKIGEFHDFFQKRNERETLLINSALKNHKNGVVSKAEADFLWDLFNQKRMRGNCDG